MQIISPKAQLILESLGRFKYLTASQMLALGIAKHDSNLRPILAKLRDLKYCDQLSFGFMPQVGKLENFHYLTKVGAELIATATYHIDDLKEIKYPRNTGSLFANDYLHRKSTIDFYTAFYLWTKQHQIEIIEANYYFDTRGANHVKNAEKGSLESRNKLILNDTAFITPDFIARINGDNRDYLFIAEIHRGADTKRLFKQLLWHASIAGEGIAQEKYDYNRGIKVYIALEKSELIPLIIKRIKETPELDGFRDMFLFTSLAAMANDFFGSWADVSLNKRNFIESREV